MIEAGPSSPLYLVGNMHREPGRLRVSAYQVQYLTEKWGWATHESFEASYDHQHVKAHDDSKTLFDRLTAEGKKVRIVTVALTMEATLVKANDAAREHEAERLKFLADYERDHPKEKP